jgi:hypothetical protein
MILRSLEQVGLGHVTFLTFFDRLHIVRATYTVADLEGGPRGPGPPLFAQNLPSNVSKTQNLRPKIRYFFFQFRGVGPPFGSGPPLFEISGSATAIYW